METKSGDSGKRILLVDDDPEVRSSMKLFLSIDRHEVTEAASGREALLLFTGGQFDLVMLDYFMPDMLGEELARNIRHLAPTQPILMLTAYAEHLVGGESAATTVLAKPINLDSLRRAVGEAISQRPPA